MAMYSGQTKLASLPYHITMFGLYRGRTNSLIFTNKTYISLQYQILLITGKVFSPDAEYLTSQNINKGFMDTAMPMQ